MAITETTIPESEINGDWKALMDRASQGESITITRDGKPLARLVPPEEPLLAADGRRPTPLGEQVIRQLRKTVEERTRDGSLPRALESIERRRRKILKSGGGLTLEEIKQFRDEGRR